MIKKFFRGVFLVITLICSLTTMVFGFGSDANKDLTTSDPNDLRGYTRENAAKPVNQGGYYGGHDTIVNEGMLLKKEVHKDDSKFQKWANDKSVLTYFRTGAHDEDSTYFLNVIPLDEPPIGPNGKGNWLRHFYNPGTGRGLKGVKSWSAPQRAHDLAITIQKIAGCDASAINNLSAQDKARVYDYFGRIMHLIEDMAVPSHTTDDIHAFIKPFETYVNGNWDQIVTSDAFRQAVWARWSFLFGRVFINEG